jgi:hypothetical protein
MRGSTGLVVAAKCSCGCGQAPAKSCRERKITCPSCGYILRVTRSWIAQGLPVCHCGERFEPCCWEDRQWMPGAEGNVATDALQDQMAKFDLRSVNAKKAILMRRRCKLEECGRLVGRGELYCASHAAHAMPF